MFGWKLITSVSPLCPKFVTACHLWFVLVTKPAKSSSVQDLRIKSVHFLSMNVDQQWLQDWQGSPAVTSWESVTYRSAQSSQFIHKLQYYSQPFPNYSDSHGRWDLRDTYWWNSRMTFVAWVQVLSSQKSDTLWWGIFCFFIFGCSVAVQLSDSSLLLWLYHRCFSTRFNLVYFLCICIYYFSVLTDSPLSFPLLYRPSLPWSASVPVTYVCCQ